MKKIISILLMLVLGLIILASCSGNNTRPTTSPTLSDRPSTVTEKTEVNVSVLNGTTGFGMANLMEKNENGNSINKYNFSVESDGSTIIAGLVKGSVDIAALPTNAASVVYNKTNGGVKVLAINTLGVLYVVQTGNSVKTIDDLNNKTVYCPAQNPQFILQYILNKNKINCTIDTKYSAPADLRAALASGELGENAIAVLPEPMVTMAKAANKSINVALDLTKEWNEVNNKSLVQGCVVVRTEFLNENKSAVSNFMNEYKDSINELNSNVDNTAKLIVKHKIFANENVAKNAIPKCNIVFLSGNNMKTAMKEFLTSMYEVAPASIGNKLPDDSFYY